MPWQSLNGPILSETREAGSPETGESILRDPFSMKEVGGAETHYHYRYHYSLLTHSFCRWILLWWSNTRPKTPKFNPTFRRGGEASLLVFCQTDACLASRRQTNSWWINGTPFLNLLKVRAGLYKHDTLLDFIQRDRDWDLIWICPDKQSF